MADMPDMTCVRCGKTVSPQLIDFLPDGAVCRSCLVTEASNPAAIAAGERALDRSTGKRALFIGIVMLAIGIGVLSVGISGAGQIMILPIGLLVGGLVEIARGISKLS